MDVRDVLKDATSIGRMAQTYIHIAEFSDVDLEEKKRNIMKQAWVYKRNKDMFKSWHKRFVFLVSSPPGIVYYKQNPWDSNSPELAININVRGFIDFRKSKLRDLQIFSQFWIKRIQRFVPYSYYYLMFNASYY